MPTQKIANQDDLIKQFVATASLQKRNELESLFQIVSGMYRLSMYNKDKASNVRGFIEKLQESLDIKIEQYQPGQKFSVEDHKKVGLLSLMVMKICEEVKTNNNIRFARGIMVPIYKKFKSDKTDTSVCYKWIEKQKNPKCSWSLATKGYIVPIEQSEGFTLTKEGAKLVEGNLLRFLKKNYLEGATENASVNNTNLPPRDKGKRCSGSQPK